MVLLILLWCLCHANDHRPLLDTGRCNPVIDDGGTEGIANISFSQNPWNSFVFYLGFRKDSAMGLQQIWLSTSRTYEQKGDSLKDWWDNFNLWGRFWLPFDCNLYKDMRDRLSDISDLDLSNSDKILKGWSEMKRCMGVAHTTQRLTLARRFPWREHYPPGHHNIQEDSRGMPHSGVYDERGDSVVPTPKRMFKDDGHNDWSIVVGCLCGTLNRSLRVESNPPIRDAVDQISKFDFATLKLYSGFSWVSDPFQFTL